MSGGDAPRHSAEEVEMDAIEMDPVTVRLSRDPTSREEQEDEEETVTNPAKLQASAFVRATLRYPFAVLLLSLLVVFPAVAFGVLRFSLSDPEGGQLVRDSLMAEQAHAFLTAVDDIAGEVSTTRRPQQTVGVDTVVMFFVAGDTYDDDVARTTNVLTLENIQIAAKLEDELVALENWETVCLRLVGQAECGPLRSAIPYLREATDEASLRAAIDQLYEDFPDEKNDLGKSKDVNNNEERDTNTQVSADWFFAADIEDRYSSYVLRSELRLGGPQEGFLNDQDEDLEQRAYMKEKFLQPAESILVREMANFKDKYNGDLTLLYYNQYLFPDETARVIIGDLFLVGGSLAFIFVIMTVHTTSFFLSTVGLLQVLFSFPATLFIYAVVARIKLFGVLQAAAVFIILGIGADDIFILTDALMQMPADGSMSEEQRFGRAFASAFKTMLTTSMTTAFAFAMTAIIKIPTVRYFAVFTTIMILVNFVLVCTIYFPALIIWDRYLRFSCCQKGVGHDKQSAKKEAERCSSRKLLRACCSERIGPLLVGWPKLIACIMVALSLFFLAFAVQLKEPTAAVTNPYWPKDHHVARQFDLDRTVLNKDTSTIEVRLVFGIDTIDRTGTDPTDDFDLGTPVYLEDFDLTQVESQAFMADLCDRLVAESDSLSIKADPIEEGELDFHCFMTEFKNWRLNQGKSFPLEPNLFVGEYREFLGRNEAIDTDVGQQVGFKVEDGELIAKFVQLDIRTSVSYVALLGTVQELEAKYVEFIGRENARTVPSVGRFYSVSQQFLYFSSVAQASTTAWTSVSVSVVIAAIVLLAFTRNWILTAIATINIAFIVIGVVGLITLYGWSLTQFEAVCITILVGFSVDYTVHLAVAYAEDGIKDDRISRVLHSITTMGISVTTGALSTAGATVFLFGTTISFFTSFGAFLLTAVCVAFIWAVFAFMSVLTLMGPEGGRGDISFIFNSCRSQADKQDRQSLRDNEIANKKSQKIAFVACVFVAVVSLAVVLGTALSFKPEDLGSGTDVDLPTDTFMPAFSELDEDWNEMRPGGDTLCSRGTPYVFFVKKGDPNKVILELMGGGACWSPVTCGLQTATFSETVDGVRTLFAETKVPKDYSREPGESSFLIRSGIEDPSAPEFKDWTHIYIPYCTGDIHWGNATVEYQSGVTVEHRGAINAGAAVNWMYENFVNPSKILVTGCSAGAYGSLLWATKIGPFYKDKDTHIVQFADSGAGVITEEFRKEAFPQWNAAAQFPWESFPADIAGDKSNSVLADYGIPDLYTFAAQAYPDQVFSQYLSAFDANQARFLYAMLNPDDEPPLDPRYPDKLIFNTMMRELYDNNTALLETPNYRQWIGWGDEHCIVPYNRYWYTNLGEYKIDEWVLNMTNKILSEETRLLDCADENGDQEDCMYGLTIN